MGSARRRLVECSLLMDNDRRWVLTEQGKDIAGKAQGDSMRAFAHRYRGLRGNALIAETYCQYPYYTVRSEIAKRVLRNDRPALDRIESARPEGTSSRLLTIGYEGRTLESYLNTLLLEGVTLLCDVRRNAISRKYGFSKNTLARACAGVGIRYEHLPEMMESNRDSVKVSKPRRISRPCSGRTSNGSFRCGLPLWKKSALGCDSANL